jgi:Papain fold toxin 2
MTDERGENVENQLGQIRALAEQYDIGTCLQCAIAIKAFLKDQNIKGRHIRVETLSPHGLQGIIYDDGTNQQIATNGFHEGIAIEIEGVEKVFDNLYPEGKPIDQWRQDLVVIPGNQLNIIIKEEFE